MLNLLLFASVSLFAIALAGIISNRHFIVIMLGVELIFIASIFGLISFFSYARNPDPSAVIMLIALWSVAAAEVIALITFYVYMKAHGSDFDVVKLSRLKW
jgi:NADH:ubiquinone oxidoreductase subunit K